MTTPTSDLVWLSFETTVKVHRGRNVVNDGYRGVAIGTTYAVRQIPLGTLCVVSVMNRRPAWHGILLAVPSTRNHLLQVTEAAYWETGNWCWAFSELDEAVLMWEMGAVVPWPHGMAQLEMPENYPVTHCHRFPSY